MSTGTDNKAATLYLRWSDVLGDWMTCRHSDKGAIAFARVMPAPKYFNVTMDVYDGAQYGMYTLCVEGVDEKDANAKAVQAASDDGFSKIKVMFTRQ